MSLLSQDCAQIAYKKVKEAGGYITFDEFDKAMENEKYFIPFNWIAGWGLPPKEKKANNDKMCAFEAVGMGLIEQTENGYKVAG
jgi:hypothetical protein